MVNRKRRIALKAGIILLAVMLFFTFFSSTINYFLTPKVTITLTRRGMLTVSQDDYVYGTIIPQIAIINGSSVYVVTQKDTFLGTELRAELRYITVATKSMGQAVVDEGLNGNEYIITSWDRPIRDGQRVLLPND